MRKLGLALAAVWILFATVTAYAEINWGDWKPIANSPRIKVRIGWENWDGPRKEFFIHFENDFDEPVKIYCELTTDRGIWKIFAKAKAYGESEWFPEHYIAKKIESGSCDIKTFRE